MNLDPSSENFVRIRQAAEILGVSVDTLRRWERKGEIKSIRSAGGHRLFSLEQIRDYKKNRPLTVSQAATELGISTSKLRGLEHKGLIKPYRNRLGERQYSRQILEDYQKNTNQAASSPK